MGAYMKISGIDGESMDQGHQGWIDIQSVSQDVVREGQGGGRGSFHIGQAKLHDIRIDKKEDKATPKIFAAACSGKKFDEILIDLTSNEGQGERTPFLQWKLTNCYISSQRFAADFNPEKGLKVDELVTFSFEKVELKYTPFDVTGKSQGPVIETWNVQAGAS